MRVTTNFSDMPVMKKSKSEETVSWVTGAEGERAVFFKVYLKSGSDFQVFLLTCFEKDTPEAFNNILKSKLEVGDRVSFTTKERVIVRNGKSQLDYIVIDFDRKWKGSEKEKEEKQEKKKEAIKKEMINEETLPEEITLDGLSFFNL